MASRSPAQSTLFILDFGTAHDPNDPLHRGRLIRAASDGTSFEPIVDNLYLPDAIDILQDEGRLYWTCMGIPGVQDGSVHSCLLDGTDLKQVVPTGLLNTPKQLVLDPAHRKIYTCDREGLKILRCDLDGKHLEVLVQTGDPNVGDHKADQMRWCVGLAIHWDERKMYWTQKGPNRGNRGRIFRANIDIPDGYSAGTRRDIECVIDRLPEPIDLEIDPLNKTLYWTDRGDVPWGNSINRCSIGLLENANEPLSGTVLTPPPYEILARSLHEAIGLKLDLQNERVFVTDMGGCVYSIDLNGTGMRKLYADRGTYTGITLSLVDNVP